MIFGYARVSTIDQSLNLQVDALSEYGCEQLFQEKVSGARTQRKELDKMLGVLRKGDRVVVWKLCRLGRSMRHLVELISKFNQMGVEFVSLKDSIDTSTSTGKFLFHIMASLVEFEREMIRERTKEGLKAARARGRVGGRPKGLSKEAKQKAQLAVILYKNREHSVDAMCKILSLSKTSFYRYLRHQGVRIGS